MAVKKYSRDRLGSMGSQILESNEQASAMALESANDFESLFLNPAPTAIENEAAVKEQTAAESEPQIDVEVKRKNIIKEEKMAVGKKESAPKKTKPDSQKKKKESIEKQQEVKDENYLSGKRGRKKVFNEERITIFAKCGKNCFDKMTDLRYAEKKPANTYLCDLVKKEKDAYDKNPQGYVANRRKKAEAVYKMEKGADTGISFKVNRELADFMDDIIYEIRCSKELFIRTIIEIDHEKKA